MKRIVLFILFSSSLAIAQASPGKAKVSAEAILDHYRQAIGGEKLESLKTADITASVTIISGRSNGFDIHFWREFPDKDLLELDTRSHGIARFGHRAGKEFRDKTVTGVAGINFVSAVSMNQALSAVTDKNWKDRFSQADLMGVANLGQNKCYVLGLTLKEGNRQVWYIDSTSYLLARIDMAEEWKEVSGGRTALYKVEVNFSDYSDAAGLKLPRTISFDASAWVVRLELAHIRFDIPIDDKIFATRQ